MRTFRIAGLTPRIRFIVINGLTLVPLAAADKALYRAKELGRNTVAVFADTG